MRHSKKKKELLAKAHEEFSKKEKAREKEFSELQQLYHSKNEELAKRENEFKHQLEEKDQKIQEYSHLLQECLDALHAQKLKSESQSIQLLHSSQGMYCITAHVYVTPFVLNIVVLPNEEQQSQLKETIQLKEKRTIELKEEEIQERVDTLYQQKVNAQKVNHLSESTQCSITADRETRQVQEGINILNLMSQFNHVLCITIK